MVPQLFKTAYGEFTFMSWLHKAHRQSLLRGLKFSDLFQSPWWGVRLSLLQGRRKNESQVDNLAKWCNQFNKYFCGLLLVIAASITGIGLCAFMHYFIWSLQWASEEGICWFLRQSMEHSFVILFSPSIFSHSLKGQRSKLLHLPKEAPS